MLASQPRPGDNSDRARVSTMPCRQSARHVQGAAEKSGPLNFFAVFSATVWDFNTKFYSFIY